LDGRLRNQDSLRSPGISSYSLPTSASGFKTKPDLTSTPLRRYHRFFGSPSPFLTPPPLSHLVFPIGFQVSYNTCPKCPLFHLAAPPYRVLFSNTSHPLSPGFPPHILPSTSSQFYFLFLHPHPAPKHRLLPAPLLPPFQSPRRTQSLALYTFNTPTLGLERGGSSPNESDSQRPVGTRSRWWGGSTPVRFPT